MPAVPIKVTFKCPVCHRTAALIGTPERIVAIAEALDWQLLKPNQVGPLPLMACSVPCWQRFWLQSDDLEMKRAVQQMVTAARPAPAAPVLLAPPRCDKPN